MIDLTGIGIVFLILNSILLISLPRQWAPLPLLVCACYMTLAQGIKLGPFHFTILRIILAFGLARIIIRGERLTGGINKLDRLIIIWGCWALVSSFFHTNIPSAFIFRTGLVYNVCGLYFLLRVFCQSLEDTVVFCRITAFLLSPVALEMLCEKLTAHNFFSVFGGVTAMPAIREGHIRAQGPFAHAILAGTVGAVCLPLMVGVWRQYLKTSLLGIFACLIIVFSSRSSGPLMSALAAIGALFMWRFRYNMRAVRWMAVLGYIGLDLVMKAPAYYLLARVDLAGGSTGWHRAELINSAIRHLNEWWLSGTDYTRHWMPTGVSWSPAHTDITNHYLQMGVLGGLPLMFLFIAILAKGFSTVGQLLQFPEDLPQGFRFLLWSFGASVFANAATSISVSFFDQSFVFLYLPLAVIGSAFSETIGYAKKV